MMKYFAYKLIPSRSTFANDMTPEERLVMTEHTAYWRDQMKKGTMLVFGPVLDPAAVYGLGIIAASDESQAREFVLGDPATTIHRFELFPMLAVTPDQLLNII